MNAASTPEFKQILKDEYGSGRHKTSGEVLSAAWRIWKRDYGVESSPEQKKRYAYRKSFENPRKKKAVVKKNPIAIYNPQKHEATILPMTKVELSYRRSTGEFRGKWFKHDFKSSVVVLGLPDGSIQIKSMNGKRLWGTV